MFESPVEAAVAVAKYLEEKKRRRLLHDEKLRSGRAGGHSPLTLLSLFSHLHSLLTSLTLLSLFSHSSLTLLSPSLTLLSLHFRQRWTTDGGGPFPQA